MAYCTKDDMLDRGWEKELIQLTDKAVPRTGEIDDTALTQSIDDATETINGYIGKYLPLPAGYTGLVLIACDIARYLLYDNKATEQVIERYNRAISYLKMVAKGEIQLVNEDTGEAQTVDFSLEFESTTRIFKRDL